MVHGFSYIKYSNFFRVSWVLLIGLMLLLNGCTTLQRKDGPPSYPVDVSQIPDAQPKVEKLAKYGNMPSYRVFGKKYRVLTSAKNFQQRGIASWYGTKFHKLRTSSGEPYDMLAMTAAHKTLPLPTYVEVTNLKNGNKVIVKVNDRGPFASNRVIDLSYVAAKKLGMVGHGTTYVNIRAIDPNDMYGPPRWFAQSKVKQHHMLASTQTHRAHSSVYLQVGAFKNKLYAEKLKRRLLPLIPSPVAITRLAHASKKQLYRVEIGPIKDLAAADSIKKKLRAIGLNAQHVKV